MPSLRKRVSSYLRQLSFHQEPRAKHLDFIENAFVVKYLQGDIQLRHGPSIHTGKLPADLPSFDLAAYAVGPDTTRACYTGPDGGLTAVKRSEKHLTLANDEIDFIDTPEEVAEVGEVMAAAAAAAQSEATRTLDNSTMLIKMAGQEYYVTNGRSKSQSLSSLHVDKTKRLQPTTPSPPPPATLPPAPPASALSNNNDGAALCDRRQPAALAKSRSATAAFRRTEMASAARPPSRPQMARHDDDDAKLPAEWRRRADCAYGVSDSLYDRNPSTKVRNGAPIADCFGVMARADSAILAVADGVNWGAKAAVAAKSAVHGCMRYLSAAIFHDTRPFDRLRTSAPQPNAHEARTPNTHDVHVCLLRAFNCAHDLILANDGMLTTLTVAVVLPLRARTADGAARVVCACTVGDSGAFVYSPRDGVRELTRGAHDITQLRDMRDALGALGPVDGARPELGNLTLSVSTLHAGDVVLLATDGLTDNFDPVVCRFAAGAAHAPPKPPRDGATCRPMTSLRRAKTSVELRGGVARNADGLPIVTAVQKYELTLLLMEDVLRQGIGGRGVQHDTPTARQLCDNLLAFVVGVTSAKRRTLEDADLYYSSANGVLVELSALERKARRRRALDRVQHLPGKLDHVTVVAANVV